jgi:hypothetical protein
MKFDSHTLLGIIAVLVGGVLAALGKITGSNFSQLVIGVVAGSAIVHTTTQLAQYRLARVTVVKDVT